MLDGRAAVATAEGRCAEAAVFGATHPWRGERARPETNWLDEPRSDIDAGAPRPAMAAAMGLALSGQRATVFLSGPDLALTQDLLRQAAGRHLPLVAPPARRARPAPAARPGLRPPP